MAIECGVTSCAYNQAKTGKYGLCSREERENKNIVLKFRAAFDAGRGTIVMVECLNMQLPESTGSDAA